MSAYPKVRYWLIWDRRNQKLVSDIYISERRARESFFESNHNEKYIVFSMDWYDYMKHVADKHKV